MARQVYGSSPRAVRLFLTLTAAGWTLAGCAAPTRGPIVIYLDGAGWYTGGGGVERGLRRAGYTGAFETFTWSAFLGPAHDHLVTAHDRGLAKRLADRIAAGRKANPNESIHLIGLSAGTAVILNALETLPRGCLVENVVLLSPTVSAERDLTKAMQKVRRNLYATCSTRDAIVGTLAINADGRRGPPAGEKGFKMPRRARVATQRAYARVVNIPWKASYTGFHWDGSHTGVTDATFVAAVIAPRLLRTERHPLDRPLAAVLAVAGSGEQP